jgi:hypothetical protein
MLLAPAHCRPRVADRGDNSVGVPADPSCIVPRGEGQAFVSKWWHASLGMTQWWAGQDCCGSCHWSVFRDDGSLLRARMRLLPWATSPPRRQVRGRSYGRSSCRQLIRKRSPTTAPCAQLCAIIWDQLALEEGVRASGGLLTLRGVRGRIMTLRVKRLSLGLAQVGWAICLRQLHFIRAQDVGSLTRW